MKLTFIVKRWANFYFFVQNLSEWHSSNRKGYNAQWQKELGVLTQNEKQKLDRFREIHQKYPFGGKYLGRHFFLREKPLETLKDNVSQVENMVVGETFSVLEEKFARLYEKDEPLIKEWQKTLTDYTNNPDVVSSVNSILSVIFKVPPIAQEIKVYLLLSTADHSGGMGGVVTEQSVLLETSRQPLSQKNHAMGIVWHEILHLPHFKKHFFQKLLDNTLGSDKPAKKFVEEATISALFPNGILGRESLDIRRECINPAAITPKQQEKILSLVDIYIKNGKPFDSEYIKELSKLATSK